MSTWHDGVREHSLAEVDGPAGAVVGWRSEPIVGRRATTHEGPRYRPVHQLRRRSKLPDRQLPFLRFDDSGRCATAWCWATRYVDSGGTIGHLERRHLSPDADCQCGYRVVPDLDTFVRYYRAQRAELRRRPDLRITALTPFALYRVIGHGRVLSSDDRFDDPPGSFRVSDLRLADTVLLPATGVGRAARRYLDRLGPVTNVHYVADLLEVSGGAATPTSPTRAEEPSR